MSRTSPRTAWTGASSRSRSGTRAIAHGDVHACRDDFMNTALRGPWPRRWRPVATEEGPDGREAGLPLASAPGHGRPWHVPDHGPARAAVRRGITLSSSQVYRLVTERPERLSLKILMALLDILDCTMDDLIEPVEAAGQARKTRAAGGGAGVGDLRLKRAGSPGPMAELAWHPGGRRRPDRCHRRSGHRRRAGHGPSLAEAVVAGVAGGRADAATRPGPGPAPGDRHRRPDAAPGCRNLLIALLDAGSAAIALRRYALARQSPAHPAAPRPGLVLRRLRAGP